MDFTNELNRDNRATSTVSNVSLTECEAEEDYGLKVSDLTLGMELGRGNFSIVKKGQYKGQTVAVKMQKLTDPDLEKYLKKELAVLRRCGHPGLVQYIGASKVGDDMVYIVTEYLPCGTLRQLLSISDPLGWRLRVKIMKGVASALHYLHLRGIIHRDIKSDNILLNETLDTKLCDFGFARKNEPGKTMTMCGTDEFMAPEVLFGMPYDEKADVFSFGVVLAEVVTRKVPGKETGFLDRLPRDGFEIQVEELRKEYELVKNVPTSITLLTEECVKTEAHERPAALDVEEWLEELFNELPADTVPIPDISEKKVQKQYLAQEGSHISYNSVESTGDLDIANEAVHRDQIVRVSAALQRTSIAYKRILEQQSKMNVDGLAELQEAGIAPIVEAEPTKNRLSSRIPSLRWSKDKSQKIVGAPPPSLFPRGKVTYHDNQPTGNSRTDIRETSPSFDLFKHGYVWKRGGRFKSWKHRYMVLTDEGLVYFKSKQDFRSTTVPPQGAILFENMVEIADSVCSIVPSVKTGKSYSFQVHTLARNYFMSVKNEKEQRLWLNSIAKGYESYSIRKII